MSKASARKSNIKQPARSKRDDSFEAVAKRLECDTDMDKFKEKLGKIARAKPQVTK